MATAEQNYFNSNADVANAWNNWNPATMGTRPASQNQWAANHYMQFGRNEGRAWAATPYDITQPAPSATDTPAVQPPYAPAASTNTGTNAGTNNSTANITGAPEPTRLTAAENYIKNNPDVKTAWDNIDTTWNPSWGARPQTLDEFAYTHFLQNGQNEGRVWEQAYRDVTGQTGMLAAGAPPLSGALDAGAQGTAAGEGQPAGTVGATGGTTGTRGQSAAGGSTSTTTTGTRGQSAAGGSTSTTTTGTQGQSAAGGSTSTTTTGTQGQSQQRGGILGDGRWNVTADQTVEGRLQNLLNQDNPLVQMAQTRGLQDANARGLLNSSLGAEAGALAHYQYAMPIAQQDAGTYADAARTNATNTVQLNRDQAGYAHDVNMAGVNYGYNSRLSKQSADQQLERDRAGFDHDVNMAGINTKNQSSLSTQSYNQNRSLNQDSYAQQMLMAGVNEGVSSRLSAQGAQQELARLNQQHANSLSTMTASQQQAMQQSYLNQMNTFQNSMAQYIQRIQESDMPADQKTAQIGEIQYLFGVNMVNMANAAYENMPQWLSQWSMPPASLESR